MTSFQQRVDRAREWLARPRFEGIVRLYSSRDVAEQQGAILHDYPVARVAAEGFYELLKERFAEGRPSRPTAPTRRGRPSR